MNPFINAIMERSGSMALNAELDYILGEDFFDEGDEGDEGEGEPQEQQEDFFDEGGEEESEEEQQEESENAKKIAAAKIRRRLLRRGLPFKKKGKGKKKRIRRAYTKREIKVLSKLRKKLRKKKADLKAGKWIKSNRRQIDRIKRRMQKIRDRARRRYLNRRDKRLKKGSSNQIIHLANPFAVKENAVIRGMPQEEQDAYIRNKSISSGVLLGVLASGFYAFYKREESAAYVLQDGGVMSKGQYYENEEYVQLSHTEKETFKEALTEDPKMTGGIFAAATAIGTFWANNNFKNQLKEEE